MKSPENFSEGIGEAPIELPLSQREQEADSPEIKNFKGKIEDMVGPIESLVMNFRARSEYGFTEFLDDEAFNRLSQSLAGLRELNVYADRNFDQTNELLSNLLRVVDSIGIQGRPSLNDDLESVQGLGYGLKVFSEKAGDFEFAAKKINTPASLKTAELSARLKEDSLKGARFIFERAQALAAYLS